MSVRTALIFRDLISDEDTDFEFKAAQGKDTQGALPSSFWETYSAMANTDGGIVVLGVGEGPDGLLFFGLKNPRKVRKELFDNANSRQSVSANLLDSSAARIIEDEEGRSYLWVVIPRAERTQRPVYVGPNPLTGTFRRSFEGDYRCDEATVRRMMGEAAEDARDARFLPTFGLDDLDTESLAAYRNEFRSTKPGHPWLGLDDKEFLRNLGGWHKERETGHEGLTLAGILMFGRLPSILEAVPNYIVDYQERPPLGQGPRWVDRVTTDGTWAGNLFSFYRVAHRKLTDGLKVPFRLEEGFKRIDESWVHEALREALVNTIIHADYNGGTVGLLVERRPQEMLFRNPGGLRLPLRVALAGGVSDCRNRALQKMFQLIGAGEQAGSGLPKILRAWHEQHWRRPMLREALRPEQTVLRLGMISLLPQDALEELDQRFGERFRGLDESDRLAVVTALVEGKVTNERLQELTDVHPSDITSRLRGLVSARFLDQVGFGVTPL